MSSSCSTKGWDSMTDLTNLLAPFQARASLPLAAYGAPQLEEDRARLLAALEGVVALHKPVTYWMTHEDADISYRTKQDALEERTDLAESDLIPFELCAHCKTIEDSPCEGECTMEAGYRESLYPCATVRAVVAALGEGK